MNSFAILDNAQNLKSFLKPNYQPTSNYFKYQHFKKPTLTILFKHLVKSQMIDCQTSFAPHQELRGLFMYQRKSHLYILNTNVYYNRWIDNYILLFNIFYLNLTIQFFSNKFFIDETIALNWDNRLYTHKFFKNVKGVFLSNPIAFGDRTKRLFRFYQYMIPDVVIVLDIKTHWKTLAFIKPFGVSTIGLIPMNYNPWLVAHPMIVFMDGLFSQHFFLKFILFAKQQAATEQYEYNKNIYYSSLIPNELNWTWLQS